MLISNAIAQTSEALTATPPEGFSFANFVPLILIFTIFYFLIVRPQSKKMKEQQNMINNLKIGNKVITNSGIIGVVKDIDQKENQLELEIADGVKIKILKNFISELIVKKE